MANENAGQPVNLLLSREELLFILNLLQAQFIPGLDPDPLGELTPEQRPLALTVAGRALRARELAQVQTDGEWVLHNNLLAAIGSCAYAQSVISVFHWPPNGGDTPTRYFGHIRGDDIVAHTRPEDVLHRFALLPSQEQLMAEILTLCNYENGVAATTLELTVPSAVFAEVRELAGGDTAKAVELLVSHGATSETAKAFVDTLAGSPSVSILQTLKQQEDGAVQKQDLTLLQSGHQAWLIIASPDEAAPLRIKSTTKAELRAALAKGL